MKISHKIRQLLARWIPSDCLLCAMDTNSITNVCRLCRVELPLIVRGCKFCGITLSANNTLESCGQCMTQKPIFDSCTAAFMYEGSIRRLISEFKFSANFAAGYFLCDALSRKLAELNLESSQCIVPIPIHSSRLRERGFNQSAIIAKQIALVLNKPYYCGALVKNRVTVPQSSLSSAKQRLKNLSGSFSVSQSFETKGFKSVLLVDDVVTTQATLTEATKVLLKAGVREVRCLCLARA